MKTMFKLMIALDKTAIFIRVHVTNFVEEGSKKKPSRSLCWITFVVFALIDNTQFYKVLTEDSFQVLITSLVTVFSHIFEKIN